jgi:Cof subfamily protein (haloacid dehalogenase superfamily)
MVGFMARASKLFVTDLDGTLLNAEGMISDVSLSILTRLIDEGLPFTVASARSAVSMREVLRGLPVKLPVIEINGAFITDMNSGRHLHCEAIPADIARSAIATGDEHGMTPVMATFDGLADHVYLLPPRNEGVAGYVTGRMAMGDRRLRQVTSLAPALREQVMCLTYMERPEVLAPLHAALQARCGGYVRLLMFPEQYFPPWHWLAVYAGKATKAHALERLAGDLGVNLDEVTVFGDQVNDVPMFEKSGHAVAVANAVPELQPHTDETIGHHTDDSVAFYLESVWANRRR